MEVDFIVAGRLYLKSKIRMKRTIVHHHFHYTLAGKG